MDAAGRPRQRPPWNAPGISTNSTSATRTQLAELLLGWYLIFFAVFAVFPFVFLKQFSDKIFPWAAAALAGPAQFLLIFRLVKIAWPNSVMGLLPAAFAVPALLSLVVVLKDDSRRKQIAPDATRMVRRRGACFSLR